MQGTIPTTDTTPVQMRVNTDGRRPVYRVELVFGDMRELIQVTCDANVALDVFNEAREEGHPAHRD